MCSFLRWLINLFTNNDSPPDLAPIPEPREKYALIVGINTYQHPDSELYGCLNDNLTNELAGLYEINPNNIRVLTNELATTQNIISNLEWLVSHQNSELVFQNSSHGTYTIDNSGDEIDGYDEALVTHDGYIIDDTLGDIFDTIPQDSFLTFICDTCHSGTPSRSFIMNTVPTGIRFLKPKEPFKGKRNIVKKIGDRATLNHVVVSACRDSEVASDAFINNRWQGAFTWSLRQHLSPDKTWSEIYPDIQNTLRINGFSQTPQLNGRELATRLTFGGR